MVQHSQTKRKRDIKSKLMAAIAMLLVSAIMMVSTTYAWFTLSTAPEVTGITTSVGANGNLEMALLPTFGTDGNKYDGVDAAVAGIGTASGVLPTTQANLTWGNLVDLSDSSYGLSNIILYPSALNVTDGKLDTAMLDMPTYGSDGRVSGMESVTMTGVYNGNAFYDGGYGVRAVGTSSGMSERELAYRAALAAANSAASRANAAASNSLNEGGSALGSMAIKFALNENVTFTKEDIKVLIDTFDALIAEDGALTYIDTAIRQYIAAQFLATCADDIDFASIVKIILDKNNSLTDIVNLVNAQLGENGTFTLDTNVTNLITNLDKTLGYVTTGKAGLKALYDDSAKTEYQWSEISTYAYYLAKTDTMTLNDKPVSYWKDNMGELVSVVSKGINLKLVPDDDASTFDGIYLDIANYTGVVTGNVTIYNLAYAGFTIRQLDATMTAHPVGTPILTTIKTNISDFTTQDGSTAAANPISDYYGYVIDVAFRTNAADSYLQLQTAGVDRIYSDNTANEETMGGGATMSFSANGIQNYNPANVPTLMENIRIVFFDPETNEVFGYARLDKSTLVSDSETSTYTMDIKMYDEQNDTWVVDNTTTTGVNESVVITTLTQNEAKAVSVLVYLDGETITNADVATANLTGTMNLQFSSSAELKPMEYADLRNGDGESDTEEDEDEETPTTTTLTNVTSDTYTITSATYDGTNVVIALTAKADGSAVADSTAVTVTIDGTAHNGTVASGTVTIAPTVTVAAGSVITVA